MHQAKCLWETRIDPFFFDGERIEQIGQLDDKKEQKRLGDATKKLLGIEVLVRGRNHLDDVRKQLEQELEKIADPETKSFVQKKMALEKEKAGVTDRLKELDSNAEACRPPGVPRRLIYGVAFSSD